MRALTLAASYHILQSDDNIICLKRPTANRTHVSEADVKAIMPRSIQTACAFVTPILGAICAGEFAVHEKMEERKRRKGDAVSTCSRV